MSSRRQSISSYMPYISKSDSTQTLWNNGSNKLLSKFIPTSQQVTVTSSVSLTLPPSAHEQKTKKKSMDSNANFAEEPNTKKKGFGKLLFRKGNTTKPIERPDTNDNDTTHQPFYRPCPFENQVSTNIVYSPPDPEPVEKLEEEENETTTDGEESATEEEMEREKTAARLSKRLSGGHFGSAGGLMLSMMETNAPPEDIQESMINWKRKSGQMLQKLVLAEEEEAVSEEEEARECALKLWDEDETFVQREKIAEWLGQSKLLNANALNQYMSFFDFQTMRIDSSFRKMCSKLYFRAEAQQIDRILEAFAKRYWECNPKSILKNSDTVYAIVYSLLLLNTDLHVAQGSYTRMTRQVFVKNTMSTIHDQPANKNVKFSLLWEAHIESYLKDLYTSVKHNQILHPSSQHQTNDSDLFGSRNDVLMATNRLSVMGTRKMNDFKRNINTIIGKNATRESVLYLEDPMPRKSTSSALKPKSPHSTIRRESFSSVQSSASSVYHPPSALQDNPPYHKEGIVMRKHLLDCANQKAKRREWRECVLVVSQGQLKMYDATRENPEPTLLSKASFATLSDTFSRHNHSYSTVPQPSFSSSTISSESNSHPRTVLMHSLGSIQLSHSLSNPLPPPGYNRSRPYVFALQEPNGGVFLFQTKSLEQTLEWVSTCNYWAARESKEPLLGGVSNIEYGWGHCLNHSSESTNIFTWLPPTPTTIPSKLDEATQFESLRKYLDALNEEIDTHGDIKERLIQRFPPKSPHHNKVLSNWEAKSKYMLHEIIKYQNYCNALEKSLTGRQDDSC
ncbi:hypothetical protein BY458DRAFT_511027 [Sporodiniella umbellata]|nr:hypothetical protein BY458DRAFT_511027 [Sporodiniella umbellata]